MKRSMLACFLIVISVATVHAAPLTVLSGTASNAAGITPVRDSFRNLIGGGTVAGANGSFGGVRREINWDGVPDTFSAPNNLPANFFNVNSPRGVVFSTPGSGFQVSATAASGTPTEFGNLNATYPSLFATFSPERLFTALGSTITDVNFFLAGTNIPALTSAFGAIFTDVDLPGVTSLEFFDAGNQSLGVFFAPNIAGNETFSFVGVQFSSPIVTRVRITSGNVVLGLNGNETAANDVVAMDDFIYAEPFVAPEPPAMLLTVAGAVLAAIAGRRSGRLGIRS